MTLPGWKHAYSGKVRDLYIEDGTDDLAGADRVLMVASDRVSAFDHLLEPPHPGQGRTADPAEPVVVRPAGGHPEPPRGRDACRMPWPAARCWPDTLDMYPIECVVRGYLAGSAWAEYQRSRSICGVELPDGLAFGDRLPEPIYTPAFKAPLGEHDENITFERSVELVGPVAAELRDLSLEVYRRAAAIAEARGILIADTKFEFGADRQTGVTTLGDEVLTSDSSRYWDQDAWTAGNRTESFDKQIVRNWLAAHWDHSSPTAGIPPLLPPEIVEQTAARYRELIERLTAAG